MSSWVDQSPKWSFAIPGRLWLKIGPGFIGGNWKAGGPTNPILNIDEFEPWPGLILINRLRRDACLALLEVLRW